MSNGYLSHINRFRFMLQKQYGVLPYVKRSGKTKIILVSRRRNGGWIVPKGNLVTNKSKRESALVEAYEEAGLTGELDKNIEFRFCITSHGAKIDLTLYPMRVNKAQVKKWPESHQRKRIEVSCERAKSLVSWQKFPAAIKRWEKKL